MCGLTFATDPVCDTKLLFLRVAIFTRNILKMLKAALHNRVDLPRQWEPNTDLELILPLPARQL